MVKGFQFDVNGVIFTRIDTDPDSAIEDALDDAIERDEMPFVQAAAKDLFFHTGNHDTTEHKRAFITGSVAILAAFEESDLQAIFRRSVRDLFTDQSTYTLRRSTDERTHREFEKEERSGAYIHSEVRPHLERLFRTFNDHRIGRYVKLGGWLTAHRLDVCYEQCMDERVADKFGIDNLETIDWHQLLLD